MITYYTNHYNFEYFSSTFTDTGTLEEIILSLTNQVEQLVSLYNSSLANHNSTSLELAALATELAAKLKVLEKLEAEYPAAVIDWKNTSSTNAARIAALEIVKNNSQLLLNSYIANSSSLNSTQANLNGTLSGLEDLIEKVIESFYTSLMDILDTTRLNETIYRIYQVESIPDFACTSDGGFVLAGSVFEYGSMNSMNGIVIRLTSNGTQLWNHTFNLFGSEKIWSVAVGANDQIVVAGCLPVGYYLNNQVTGTIYIGSLDKNGNELWTYKEGTTFDGAHMVIGTSDGNFVIVGALIFTFNYQTQMVVRKINPEGVIVWQYNTPYYGYRDWMNNYFSNEYINYDATSVIETSDGGYLVAGYRNKYQWLLKLSSSGYFSWEYYGGYMNYFIQEIKEQPNGSFLAVLNRFNGYMIGLASRIIEYSSTGAKNWMLSPSLNSYLFVIYQTIDIMSDGYCKGMILVKCL